MLLILKLIAGVAKLVDAPDLGSGALGRVGSSPITRTKNPHILQLLTLKPLHFATKNATSLFDFVDSLSHYQCNFNQVSKKNVEVQYGKSY